MAGTRRAGRIRLAAVIAIIAVVLAGSAVLYANAGEESADLSQSATYTVGRGPLTISVTESGTVQSREQVIITNQVEGRTEIIFIADEGSVVQEGDLLVELDSSQLEDQKINQEISVQNAEAAFIRARENLAVAESQAKSDISQATLDHRFATEDKTRYINGEFPKERTELDSRITLAEEELERAQDRLEGSERLFAEKYIAETELDSDRLARNRAELDVQLAKANLNLLTEYTYPRRIDELDSSIEQTRLALDRTERKASADVVQAEANLRAADAEFNRQKTRLERINDQIGKTKIYAPAGGMVIYATSVGGRGRWDNSEPLQEGYQAREREELIHLPTASSLMATVQIHESALEKVQVGQSVRVRIPAVPGQELTGEVVRIAPLPDQASWWNPDLRVYTTEVHILETLEGVRTGMSCQAEIIVEEFVDTVSVPVQAVVRAGRATSVYVVSDDGSMTARAVEIGLDNDQMVRIVGGVEVGERVSLVPPLDTSRQRRGGPPGGAAQNAGGRTASRGG